MFFDIEERRARPQQVRAARNTEHRTRASALAALVIDLNGLHKSPRGESGSTDTESETRQINQPMQPALRGIR